MDIKLEGVLIVETSRIFSPQYLLKNPYITVADPRFYQIWGTTIHFIFFKFDKERRQEVCSSPPQTSKIYVTGMT